MNEIYNFYMYIRNFYSIFLIFLISLIVLYPLLAFADHTDLKFSSEEPLLYYNFDIVPLEEIL